MAHPKRDPVFGSAGAVTTDLTEGSDDAGDLGVQDDGKVTLVGRAGGGGGRIASARSPAVWARPTAAG